MKATDEDIAAALELCGGVISDAAECLGMSRRQVHRRVKRSKSLRAVIEDSGEGMKDVAERGLFAAIRNGDPWAIRFFLGRKAKDRGYTTRQEIDADVHNTGTGGVTIFLPDNGRD
ncbi:Bacterial regulatory protein, Fis family [Novipirellula galeiformis]|uniref:Bacterial regulatory protein, Fis family n=1 Tax=Novipirellula galeiformis TaxID=2528004 RepID=A0A5C6CG03_9BACT|nr:helix-turn-helix domain-containing protein [Novipirellula galeiformis]TWU22474.1 Bacterial regulatory protein, Fis family [Novipirellula galeiformis]